MVERGARSIFASTIILAACGAALSVMIACSSGTPTEPAGAATGGTTELRVRDVSGTGGEGTDPCEEEPCQAADLVVTLTQANGSTLTFSCRGILDWPIAAECQVPTGSGAFSGVSTFDLYTTSTGELVELSLHPFVLVAPDRVYVSLGLKLPARGDQAFAIEGQLSAHTQTVNTDVCEPGVVGLEVTFTGTLPHLGRVEGTMVGVCLPLSDQ